MPSTSGFSYRLADSSPLKQPLSTRDTSATLQSQWKNPNDILSLLLILGPDVVWRALAQLAGEHGPDNRADQSDGDGDAELLAGERILLHQRVGGAGDDGGIEAEQQPAKRTGQCAFCEQNDCFSLRSGGHRALSLREICVYRLRRIP